MKPPTTTRAQKRAATEQKILDVARQRFAQAGYEGTSLRAIARDAEIDPSLVVQYFGGKAELFARVVSARWPLAAPTPGAEPEALVSHVLDSFLSTLNAEGGAAVSVLIRSSLTHPESAAATRSLLFDESAVRLLAPLITGPERELRTALVAAMLLGVHVGRTLLGVKVLESATEDQLRAHLEGAVLSVLSERGGAEATLPLAKATSAGADEGAHDRNDQRPVTVEPC